MLRVWLASMYLAQSEAALADRHGLFHASPVLIARALGLRFGKDGKVHADTRRHVRQAVDLLQQLHLRLKLSPKSKETFDGPLLAPTPYRRGHASLVKLHPAVWLQIARGPAWAPWHPEALKFRDDESLLFYLHAVWLLADRKAENVATSLPRLATKAGIWNPTRFARHRGAYLLSWQERFEKMRELKLLEVRLDRSIPDPSVTVRRPTPDEPPPRRRRKRRSPEGRRRRQAQQPATAKSPPAGCP